MLKNWLIWPTALALFVTLANAAKPVVVDDAAYLYFARHISVHPLDPYGFTLFWYDEPEPAFTILAPPVIPYWLALGIRLFGESVFVLKLWLFPFIWLLAWSLHALLRRFAHGVERPGLLLLMLSPAVLATVNVMLDVPALALGLLSLVAFFRAVDRNNHASAVGTGLLMALAIQTKYTMLLIPAIAFWYGLVQRRLQKVVLGLAVGVLAFSAWELCLYKKYGESHFLHHLMDQRPSLDDGKDKGEPQSPLMRFLKDKEGLIPPFFGFLGGLGVGLSLWAGRPAGFPHWVVAGAGAFTIGGTLVVAFLPERWSVLVRNEETGHINLTVPALVWRTLGAGVLSTTALGLLLLLVKRDRRPGHGGWQLRPSRDSLFLAGWMSIEVLGYFALSPFPAGRRLIGTTLVAGLVLARVVSRVGRARRERMPNRWIVPAAVVYGILFAALDAYDAGIEKAAAERVAEALPERRQNATVWYVGHWGFGYYCDRLGLRQYLPGEVVPPGDYLVLPHYPQPGEFYRPFPGWLEYRTPSRDQAELLKEFIFDDPLPAQTVPNLYGGTEPIVERQGPRLVVGVYRMKREWSVR